MAGQSHSEPVADALRWESLAEGQVYEFQLWAELIQQSAGQLHVFLPLLDRGFDAVVHRLTDGAFIPLQAKCRTSMRWREVHVVVRDEELADDSALLVAGVLDDGSLGPVLLVVPEGEFKRLAYHWPGLGGRYEAWFGEGPHADGRWAEWLLPRSELGARLLGLPREGAAAAVSAPVTEAASAAASPVAVHDRWLGFLGEAEVIRRLAESPALDLFRPFPDLELIEVLARGHDSGRFVGLQVKAPEWHGAGTQAHAGLPARTFRPDPAAAVVVLAWQPEAGAFHEECLLIPAERIPEVAVLDGWLYLIEFVPGGGRGSRLDTYRVALRDLGTIVAARATDPIAAS